MLRTPAIEEWTANPGKLTANLAEIGQRLMHAVSVGGGHEYAPFAGQSAGLIHDVLPAAEIIRRTMDQADAVLANLPGRPLN